MAASHSAAPAQSAKPAGLSIIIAAAFSAFLATFNETFLNVAFTPIMADFGVEVTTVQWLATAYMLGAAVMTPTAGFFFRRFNTKPLYLATTATLIIGSVVAALAPNFTVLLLGRIIQSLGTGLLVPIGMNIALTVAPREKLGTFMGLMGAMTTLGPSVAIVVSGGLLELASWRLLLWFFGGLALISFIVGWIVVYNISEHAKTTLDALSVALVAVALIGLLYGISTIFGPQRLVAIAAIVIGALALAAFVRRQRTSADPLIDLRPLGVFAFRAGVTINIVALIIVFSMNILVPIHLQSVHGTTGLTASLVLFPAILMAVILGPVAGKIYDARGPQLILPLGMALMAVFSLATSWAMSGEVLWAITLWYIPAIVGSALAIGPVQSFALSKLPRHLNAHGVTIFSTSFQVAGCIGSAVSTGIYGAFVASGQGADEAANRGFLAVGALLFILAAGAAVLAVAGTRSRTAHDAAATAPEADAAAPAVTDSLVSQLMKTEVYHLPPAATIRQALQVFVDKRISAVPLLAADGTLRGIVSDGDVLGALGTQVPRFTTPYAFLIHHGEDEFSVEVAAVLDKQVADIATTDVVTVATEDDLGTISAVLAERHLKKAPVVDAAGRVVGVINRSDINRYLVATYVSATPPAPAAGNGGA
ncbi:MULTISPECIES: MFS transporter [unclassified Corynebacterium]|uniref:MFS transporter n=1 Tax=Corynebacterium sp. LK2522 TaxID=3110474 RepID=UPI0034CD388F